MYQFVIIFNIFLLIIWHFYDILHFGFGVLFFGTMGSIIFLFMISYIEEMVWKNPADVAHIEPFEFLKPVKPYNFDDYFAQFNIKVRFICLSKKKKNKLLKRI